MQDNVPPPDQGHTADNLVPSGMRQYIPLLAVGAISIALVGLITGIREPRKTERIAVPAPAHKEGVPDAVTYSEMPTAKLGRNGAEKTLAQMTSEPDIFAPVIRTEEMKIAALADRAKTRAFDGAPPTIPHPVMASSAAACLVCHGQGLKVGDRLASKISHAHLSNCSQCHVEQSVFGLPFRSESPETSFVGLYRAGPGQRASPGAPPTIPHHTWMREDCSSCHGVVTRPGTRTTHPWLTNCRQCHVASAAVDRVDFSEGRK